MNNNSDIRAAAELSHRWNDGLLMFRAMPTQFDFFQSTASEILLRGGNRSGKSVAAAARFAAVARDLPICGSDGEEIIQRLPWQVGRPLIMWVIGLQLNHIGQTIYRLLFKSGAYKIIRDLKNQHWRAFDPAKDAGREMETKPSFPLIPPSAIKTGTWAWYLKADHQFRSVMLTNGTVIYAYASTSDVKQGDPVDYVWVDEEIANIGHYAEWQARLSDTKGRIVWSSMSKSNPALLRITHRAREQKDEVDCGDRKKQDVEDFVLKFSANPYIDDEEKRKRLEGWSEDERRMRDDGEYVIGNIKVYPSFDKSAHAAIYDNHEMDDAVSRILRERNGEPPNNWTRELILDPGTANPAILFCAVPPPELWLDDEPYFVVYDEISTPRITALEIARRTYDKARGYIFRRFIIDGHAARQTPMGFAGTIGGEYLRAFRKLKLQSQETGSGFVPGDPSFPVRSRIVQSWLAFRPCGRPQLRVVLDRCPRFIWQMENNLRATIRGPDGELLPQEKPAPGQKQDLRVCVEYWASRYPTYVVPPRTTPETGGPGMAKLRSIRKRFGSKKRRESAVVYAGPGSIQ